MSKLYDAVTPELAGWLGRQKVFFVATAPLAADGLLNCSPKGLDTFRVAGPHEVGYLDLTGSGVETAAHLRENGRVVLMFCGFDGPPRIVRLHGVGEYLPADGPGFTEWRDRFPDLPGTRGAVRVRVTRVSDSCGYAVPRFEYAGDREALTRWAQKKGPAGLAEYKRQKNTLSLDGLPGLDPPG